jgi:hypothetical protein
VEAWDSVTISVLLKIFLPSRGEDCSQPRVPFVPKFSKPDTTRILTLCLPAIPSEPHTRGRVSSMGGTCLRKDWSGASVMALRLKSRRIIGSLGQVLNIHWDA